MISKRVQVATAWEPGLKTGLDLHVAGSWNSHFWKGCNRKSYQYFHIRGFYLIFSYSRVLFSQSQHRRENKTHAKISDFTVSL
jgi:hypothetical protein